MPNKSMSEDSDSVADKVYPRDTKQFLAYVSIPAFPASNSQDARPIFALLPAAGILSPWLFARELQMWTVRVF